MKEKKRTNLARFKAEMSADDDSLEDKYAGPPTRGYTKSEIATVVVFQNLDHDSLNLQRSFRHLIFSIFQEDATTRLQETQFAGSTAASMKAPTMYKPANFDRTPGANKTPRHITP